MSGDEHHPSTAPALASFKNALHSSFVVQKRGGGPVALVLDEIRTGGARPGWESFSLIFVGPNPPAFWDGLFEVEHGELGACELFLVAVQTDGDSQQYEAVFNRPTT